MSSAPAPTASGLGRWPVRILALAGSVLITVASIGWWLDSRVIDDRGFADVVAKASQRQPVRDYIADQATLRLARTSNFVSAARPVVTNALSSAIATPPVEEAIRDFAVRAHAQVFEARNAQRVDINSQQAATTVRSALQAINPALSKKLPADVLDASATISQNSVVDVLFRMSNWIWLWIPVGLVGIALLVVALGRGRDRVHAIRSVGVTLSVCGALLAGVGAMTPAIGGIVAPDDPLRGDAIATFVDTLTGRLVGAGLALVLMGLVVALAPGRDGGDLRDRVRRIRTWFETKRQSPRWRLTGGLGIMALGGLLLTQPVETARLVVDFAALIVLYVGVVVCLRSTGVLVTDHAIHRLKKRSLALVFVSMAAAAAIAATGAGALVATTQNTRRANPNTQGCNGYLELCVEPLDQVVWPAAHNSMSSAAYNFFSAEHIITVPEQLNAGARFLMLDAYYGYDDNGLVRTNLAGGVNRAALERERGKDAVRALDRMGALTGVADTSGHKSDVYFCHDLCELGAVRATDVLSPIRIFLERNRTEVVVLDFEDYVKPQDMRAALDKAGLLDRVLTVTPAEMKTKRLLDIVSPKKGQDEQPRRLIVVSEKHGGVYPWMPSTYSLFEETPYTFDTIKDFNCNPNRGKTGKSLFLINHWLRPDGPPDPNMASHVNSERVLNQRFRQCADARRRLPNVVAVDFTTIGDFYPTIDRLNGAVARLTGATDFGNRAIARARNDPAVTENDLAELRGIRRLPRVSVARARALLGAAADTLVRPPGLSELERSNQLEPSGNDGTPVTSTTTP